MKSSGMPFLVWAFLLAACLIFQACAQPLATSLVLIQGDKVFPMSIIAPGSVRLFETGSIPLGTSDDPIAVWDKLSVILQNHGDTVSNGDQYQTDSLVSIAPISSLFLRIATNASVIQCQLFRDRSQAVTASFLLYPPKKLKTADNWNFSIPLKDLPTISGFRLSVPNQTDRLTLLEVRISENQVGYQELDNQTLIPTGFRYFETQKESQFEIPANSWPKDAIARLDLEYEYNPVANALPAAVILQVLSKNFTLRLRPGRHKLPLYAQTLGFLPEKLRLTNPVEGFHIRSVIPISLDKSSGLPNPQIPESGFIAPKPILADLWGLLHYPATTWRQNFMEVFNWNLFPKIIIIDFGSLEIQDRFMKRLVFFIEKKGYRGKLQNNSVIESKHGWNANDFSAISLADFFNAAAESGFPLNAEEVFFRECLIQWGVISKQAESYQPITGGVLSLAHGAGMTDLNRTLLLQHECLHGVYFAVPEFRNTCETSFAGMDPASRDFMIKYFSFYQYDPQDHGLMVNEMQAYLLQQGLGALKSYVLTNMVGSYAKELPGAAAAFRLEARKNLAVLYQSAQFLSQALLRQTGLVNGQLACLEPLN